MKAELLCLGWEVGKPWILPVWLPHLWETQKHLGVLWFENYYIIVQYNEDEAKEDEDKKLAEHVASSKYIQQDLDFRNKMPVWVVCIKC